MLAPAIARPLSSVIGRPLARLLGEPGKLGRENSMRSPRRTAQTASALMVGLALVVRDSGVRRVAVQVGHQQRRPGDQRRPHRDRRSGPGQLSNSVPAGGVGRAGRHRDHHRLPGPVRVPESRCPRSPRCRPQNLADTVILRMTSGTAAALAQGELLIDSTTATVEAPGGRATRSRCGSRRRARRSCGSAGSTRPTP